MDNTDGDKRKKRNMTIKYFSICLVGAIFLNTCIISVIPKEAVKEVSSPKKEDTIKEIWKSWLRKTPQLVLQLSPASKPTNNKPFIFFHNRKAAGSTMRSFISKAAKKHKLHSWIPCYNGVNCIPYSLPPSTTTRENVISVYASHLNYMHMVSQFRENIYHEQLQQQNRTTYLLQHTKPMTLEGGGKGNNNITNTTSNNKKDINIYSINDTYPLFDCITNIRPTVSRVVSCWNFRMTQGGTQLHNNIPPANKLSANDWETLLPITYDEFSNGCNNEIYRTFGSLEDEILVNTMTQDHPIFVHEFEKAVSRLSRCVIVLPHHCQESNTIISHFFPWLSSEFVDLCGNVNNVGSSSDSEKKLSNASDVILSQNYMDELLYKFGEALFNEQLRIATNNNNSSNKNKNKNNNRTDRWL